MEEHIATEINTLLHLILMLMLLLFILIIIILLSPRVLSPSLSGGAVFPYPPALSLRVALRAAHHHRAEAITGRVGLYIAGIKEAPAPLPAALPPHPCRVAGHSRSIVIHLTALKFAAVGVAGAGPLHGLAVATQADIALGTIRVRMAEALIHGNTATPDADLPFSAGAVILAFIVLLEETETLNALHIRRAL